MTLLAIHRKLPVFKTILAKTFSWNCVQCNKSKSSILFSGCGNSTLSEEMYKDGYPNIINVDFSEICIEKMREKHQHCPGMEWEVMDIKDLKWVVVLFFYFARNRLNYTGDLILLPKVIFKPENPSMDSFLISTRSYMVLVKIREKKLISCKKSIL